MAGTAPTDLQFTKKLDAGPVHCSDWLCFVDRRLADAMLVVARHVVAVSPPAANNPVWLPVIEWHFVRHLALRVEDAIEAGSIHELGAVEYLAPRVADDQGTVPKTFLLVTLAADNTVFENRSIRAVRDPVHVLLLGASVRAVTVDPNACEVVGAFRMFHLDAGWFPRSIT
jgi:hypothetical protein